MKAVEIKKTGGPEVLQLNDITLDKPEPNEVTIEQKAIGLNYIDTYHRSGLYPLKLPIGLGFWLLITSTDEDNTAIRFLSVDISASTSQTAPLSCIFSQDEPYRF